AAPPSLRPPSLHDALPICFDIGAAGRINTKLTWTHTLADDFTAVQADKLERAGDFGRPDDRGQLVVAWERGDFGAAVIANYIGPHEDTEEEIYIPSWTTFDAQGNVNVPWNGRVTLGVRDVGDMLPRFSDAHGSPVYDDEHDSIGGRVRCIRYEQNV